MSYLAIVRGLPGSSRNETALLLKNGLYGEGYEIPLLLGPEDFFSLREGEPLFHNEAHAFDSSALKAHDPFYEDRLGRGVRMDAGPYSLSLRAQYMAHATRWAKEHLRDLFASSPSKAAVLYGDFPDRKELEPYLAVARHFSVKVTVVDCFDGGKGDEELSSLTGIPARRLARSRGAWTHDWSRGPEEHDVEGVFARPVPGKG